MSANMTNADRAARARVALGAYMRWPEGLEPDPDAIFEAIGDLLCDLRHLIDPLEATDETAEETWQRLIARGESHYEAEVLEEAPWRGRPILRALADALIERIDDEHFPVERELVEDCVLEWEHRIEQDVFIKLDALESDILLAHERQGPRHDRAMLEALDVPGPGASDPDE